MICLLIGPVPVHCFSITIITTCPDNTGMRCNDVVEDGLKIITIDIIIAKWPDNTGMQCNDEVEDGLETLTIDIITRCHDNTGIIKIMSDTVQSKTRLKTDEHGYISV